MHMGNIPFILLKGLMMKTELTCPKCGAIVEKYLNPKPTVDIVIHDRERGLVLVDRKNPPYGNALPGGFIDLGESAEQADVREAFEETNLRVRLTGFLSSTFCCSLFAVRCSLSAVRCSLFAARRSPLVACAYCSPAACYSPLSVCRHSPPSQLADRKQPLRGSIPLRQTRFCPDMR